MLNNTFTTRHISLLAILAFLFVSFFVLMGYLNSEPPIDTEHSGSLQYNEINKLENASKVTAGRVDAIQISLDTALRELDSALTLIRHLEQSVSDATFRIMELENNDRQNQDLIASITRQIIAFQGENAELKRILDNVTTTEKEILAEVHKTDESSPSTLPNELPSTQTAIEKCQLECPDTVPVAEFSKSVENKTLQFQNTCNFTLLDTELITSCSNIDEYGITQMNPTMLKNLPCDDTLYNNYRYQRCAVVSNSGSLLRLSDQIKIFVGEVIDAHDFVVRLNLAPVEGYEKYVGSKTSMRVMDRLAFQSWIELVKNNVANEITEENSIKVVRYVSNNALKSFDVDDRTYNNHTFLLSKDFGLAMSNCLYSSAPTFQTELQTRGYEATPRTASTGLLAVSMMIPLCEHLNLYGFHSSPTDKLHYFGNNTATYDKYMKGVKFHNLELEHLMLKSWQKDNLVIVVE